MKKIAKREKSEIVSPPVDLRTKVGSFHAPVVLATAGLTPGAVKRGQVTALRDQLALSLARLGGAAYLEALGREEPAVYAALLGKLLPLQVTGEDGGPVEVVHTFRSEV